MPAKTSTKSKQIKEVHHQTSLNDPTDPICTGTNVISGGQIPISREQEKILKGSQKEEEEKKPESLPESDGKKRGRKPGVLAAKARQ